MAQKQVAALVKIQIPAGQASPAPPVGTALGPHGVAIMDFCKEYNAKTEDKRGQIIPVEITIYEDRSFTFITKTPPTSFLIRQAAGLEKDRVIQALNLIENQERGEQRTLNLVHDYDVSNVSEKVIRILYSYRDYIMREVWKEY